jgi:subtilisin family serine protease
MEYLQVTNDILNDGRRYGDKKVKIAILDTGVDLTHPEVRKLLDEAREWRPRRDRITSTSFIKSIGDGKDHNGHGTHIAVTVMRIAAWAEVYAATVADATGKVHNKSVVKASNLN